MAIQLEKEHLQEQIDHLKHNLLIQNIPNNEFLLIFRHENNQFVYAKDDQPFEVLSNDDFKNRSSLLFAIFEAKQDRDVLMLTRPEFAIQMLEENREIEPVLDDLPQIVGLRCKIGDASNEDKILSLLEKHDALLLKNFNVNQAYVMTLAPSIDRVLAATLIVEKSAQAMVEGKCLGGTKKLSASICKYYRKAYLTAYSQMDKSITSQTKLDFNREISGKELTLRQQIADYGMHLIDENLTLGTWGNLSLRLDNTYMLITPSGMAYDRITPYDIVRVNYQTMEHEGKLRPSVETGFHAAIYREHSDINAIIHTHSFNCSVFAATHQALPIIMPEAIHVLGSKTGYVPYYRAGTEQLAKAVAKTITDDTWCTIMGNHGLACCGKDMEDVFERTKLMERAARYYLDMHQA